VFENEYVYGRARAEAVGADALGWICFPRNILGARLIATALDTHPNRHPGRVAPEP